MKASSTKFSLSMFTLLGLAAITATPTLADAIGNPEPQPISEIQTNELKAADLPFFARFLEGQHQEIAQTKIALIEDRTSQKRPLDRPEMLTRKYPSDAEDNSGSGMGTTQKYPSDGEDNSGGGTVTYKYPSDGEDNSGGGTVTYKYPSDGEDNSGGGTVTYKYPSDGEDNSGGNMYPHRRHRH